MDYQEKQNEKLERLLEGLTQLCKSHMSGDEVRICDIEVILGQVEQVEDGSDGGDK